MTELAPNNAGNAGDVALEPKTCGGLPAIVPHHGPVTAMNFAAAVSATEAAFSKFCDSEIRFDRVRSKRLNHLLASAFALHLAGQASPDEYEAFLRARNVKPHAAAGTPHHMTIKALVPPADRAALRQSITEYGQALAGMECAGVMPGKAAAWLETADHVNGRKISGVHKAVAIFKTSLKSEPGTECAVSAPGAKFLEEVVAAAKDAPLAVVPVNDNIEGLARQPSIALVDVTSDGSLVFLRVLTSDPVDVARLTKRYAA